MTAAGLAAVLSAIATVLTALGIGQVWQILAARRQAAEARQQSTDVADVKRQVVNDHGSQNLRDDIDKLNEVVAALTEAVGRVEETLRGHGLAIGGIRDGQRLYHADLGTERAERIAGDLESKVRTDDLRSDLTAELDRFTALTD